MIRRLGYLLKFFSNKFMTQITNFFLNGQKYFTNKSINLIDLVNYFKYDDSLLVLEYNNLICNKKKWKQIQIKNQDKIEIVTIVGGG
jgi:sulfur carrier protein